MQEEPVSIELMAVIVLTRPPKCSSKVTFGHKIRYNLWSTVIFTNPIPQCHFNIYGNRSILCLTAISTSMRIGQSYPSTAADAGAAFLPPASFFHNLPTHLSLTHFSTAYARNLYTTAHIPSAMMYISGSLSSLYSSKTCSPVVIGHCPLIFCQSSHVNFSPRSV